MMSTIDDRLLAWLEQEAIFVLREVAASFVRPLRLQRYADNRVGGALIVVDPSSNRTSGAQSVERGMA